MLRPNDTDLYAASAVPTAPVVAVLVAIGLGGLLTC